MEGGPAPEFDWDRTRQAIADGSMLEAVREHLSESEGRCVEWCPICRGAELLRASSSPELRQQWSSVQREALLTLRALIDHYLERTEPPAPQRASRVEDIPLE